MGMVRALCRWLVGAASSSRRFGAGRIRGLLLILLIGQLFAASVASASPMVYVGANGRVFVINPATDTVTATLTAPQSVGLATSTIVYGLAASPDGQAVYSTVDNNLNPGWFDPITTATTTLAAGPTVGVQPRGVAVTPDGKTAWVVNEYSNGTGSVQPVDVTTGTAGTPIGLGSIDPFAIAITPDGSRAYVTALQGTGELIPIDLATDTVMTPISTHGAFAIAITPDGRYAYLAEGSGNEVQKVDLNSGSVVDTISVLNPLGIAIDPSGTVAYVTSTSTAGSTVYPITLATDAVGTPITVGSNPRGVAFLPDGTEAFVANSNAESVTPITVSTGTAQTAISLATTNDPYPAPNSVAITPASVTGETSPSASISPLSPTGGLPYYQGEVVLTQFSCAEGTVGSGLLSCDDTNGSDHASAGSFNGDLYTSTPGTNIPYSVTARSKDGLTASQRITYTVAAPPSVSIGLKSGQWFQQDSTAPTSFTCTEGQYGPGLSGCGDSSGHTNSGAGTFAGSLPTGTIGTGETYSVTATSTDGASTTKSITYNVAAPPTITSHTQTTYINDRAYESFTCADGTGGPGIATCTDGVGSPSGFRFLDTSTLGPHSFTVTATSSDGLSTTKTIDYDVIGPAIQSPANGAIYATSETLTYQFDCGLQTSLIACQASLSPSPTGAAISPGESLQLGVPGAYTLSVGTQYPDGIRHTSDTKFSIVQPDTPTVNLVSPAAGSTLKLLQSAALTIHCSDPSGISIQSCQVGTDGGSLRGCASVLDCGGTPVTISVPLDTSTPGSHTITASVSIGGQPVTQTYTYTVGDPSLTTPLPIHLEYDGTLEYGNPCGGTNAACPAGTSVSVPPGQPQPGVPYIGARWTWSEQWTDYVDANGNYAAGAAITSLSGQLVYASVTSSGALDTWRCNLSPSGTSASLPSDLFLRPSGAPLITLPYGPSPISAGSPPALSNETSTTWGNTAILGQAFTPFLLDTAPAGAKSNGDIAITCPTTPPGLSGTLPPFDTSTGYVFLPFPGTSLPWGTGVPTQPGDWRIASIPRPAFFPTLSTSLQAMLTGTARTSVQLPYSSTNGTYKITGTLTATAQSSLASTTGSTAVSSQVSSTSSATQTTLAPVTQIATSTSVNSSTTSLASNLLYSATLRVRPYDTSSFQLLVRTRLPQRRAVSARGATGSTAAVRHSGLRRQPRDLSAQAAKHGPMRPDQKILLPRGASASRVSCPVALTRSRCAAVHGQLSAAQTAERTAANVSTALVTAIQRDGQAAAAGDASAVQLQAAMVAALDGEMVGALSRWHAANLALARAIAGAGSAPVLTRAQVAAANHRFEQALAKRGVPTIVLEVLVRQLTHPKATGLIPSLRTPLPTTPYRRALRGLTSSGAIQIITAMQNQHLLKRAVATRVLRLAHHHRWSGLRRSLTGASAPVRDLLLAISERF